MEVVAVDAGTVCADSEVVDWAAPATVVVVEDPYDFVEVAATGLHYYYYHVIDVDSCFVEPVHYFYREHFHAERVVETK